MIALLLLADLRGDLHQIVARADLGPESVSIAVGTLDAEPLFVRAARRVRIPASNQKILTAAAAVVLLGEDFRFETRIGPSRDGHLVVVGDGDPNFSGRFFGDEPERVMRLLAADLAAQGVGDVAGDLVLDASRFDDVWVHPGWPRDQLERWYCAPVAALLYTDSCWDVLVRPGARVGLPAQVHIQPALLSPPLENRCT
ncbi:MAG: D-alanyl-D-alanine carboxypeptidase, partial [Planctomycetota bacterium]